MPETLKGLRVLVTSGPTYEPIDPVRFLGNRSSGRQGHAIAAALAEAGAKVTLVAGPVSLADPKGVKTVRVQTARQMLAACEKALPVDVAVCAAAVSDWRPAQVSKRKIKKNGRPPVLALVENPDILRSIARHKKRPKMVIGFAAETESVLKNAAAKRKAKGADWIIANDVSAGRGFDAGENRVTLITESGTEQWPRMSKQKIAGKLVKRITKEIIC